MALSYSSLSKIPSIMGPLRCSRATHHSEPTISAHSASILYSEAMRAMTSVAS
jgi:hypothetical protein